MHFEFVEFFGYLEVISADGYFWLIFVPFVMYLRHHLYLHFSVFIGKNGLTFVISGFLNLIYQTLELHFSCSSWTHNEKFTFTMH